MKKVDSWLQRSSFYSVWATFGIHPHDSYSYNDKIQNELASMMTHPKCVAWGEIGLDYHYNRSDPETQKKVFVQQLKLALDHKKPIVVHTREAEEDTFALLNGLVPRDWPIHVHCFTSSCAFAEKLLSAWSNLFIGFTGMLENGRFLLS
eukprot:TRINITY_DN3742_c0_g1_i5.p1 TRINITY_DN3742_c0_g1~~TRINITY_DN3742_c0_g1_i5.p1  ORF type:complete len:149 (-),score=18.57 TRINITY_DN3742_c0_g1_i5:328-774(-)